VVGRGGGTYTFTLLVGLAIAVRDDDGLVQAFLPVIVRGKAEPGVLVILAGPLDIFEEPPVVIL